MESSFDADAGRARFDSDCKLDVDAGRGVVSGSDLTGGAGSGSSWGSGVNASMKSSSNNEGCTFRPELLCGTDDCGGVASAGLVKMSNGSLIILVRLPLVEIGWLELKGTGDCRLDNTSRSSQELEVFKAGLAVWRSANDSLLL